MTYSYCAYCSDLMRYAALEVGRERLSAIGGTGFSYPFNMLVSLLEPRSFE